MEPGQGASFHTDHKPGGPSHRVLAYLNRGWSAAAGGVLVLADGDRRVADPGRLRFVPPVPGSAFAFARDAVELEEPQLPGRDGGGDVWEYDETQV